MRKKTICFMILSYEMLCTHRGLNCRILYLGRSNGVGEREHEGCDRTDTIS